MVRSSRSWLSARSRSDIEWILPIKSEACCLFLVPIELYNTDPFTYWRTNSFQSCDKNAVSLSHHPSSKKTTVRKAVLMWDSVSHWWCVPRLDWGNENKRQSQSADYLRGHISQLRRVHREHTPNVNRCTHTKTQAASWVRVPGLWRMT